MTAIFRKSFFGPSSDLPIFAVSAVCGQISLRIFVFWFGLLCLEGVCFAFCTFS